MVGKLACSVTQGRRVVRLTPALLNQYNELHKTPSNGQSPAGLCSRSIRFGTQQQGRAYLGRWMPAAGKYRVLWEKEK
ncbi:hypothetical protein E2C01_022039 [Portunus trituberculatus]|uniref:Uncharacterized protein n=1 Tax=Portunus trituberculatus TaxID=210409 RepID=A0A5B7E4Z6_PORTR|nr:hypothetical protein [Portunus trituberculatus]